MSEATYENRILADQARLFPDSLRNSNYDNLFGGKIYFYRTGRFAEGDDKAFIVGFLGFPKSACIELATREWQGSLGLVAMRAYGSEGVGVPYLGETYEGSCTTQHTNGSALVCTADLPMPLSYAVIACDKESDNWIYLKFY